MAIDYKSEAPPLVYQFLRYLQVERTCSHLTIYNYFTDLRMFFRYILCHRAGLPLSEMERQDFLAVDVALVSSLRRGEVTDFLAWLTLDHSVKAKTKARKITVLKSFYKYLQEMEYTDNHVMSKITTPKIPKTLPKYLEEEEIPHFIQGINGTFWIRDTAIILLMVSSGLRVSEVASLDVSSMQENSVIVKGKGNKERQAYLSERTKEALLDYLDVRPPVSLDALFISRRNSRLSIRMIQHMVQKYLGKSGNEHLSCHKLRHTAATMMLKHGANIRQIQQILGHESINTTQLYTHVTDEELLLVLQTKAY